MPAAPRYTTRQDLPFLFEIGQDTVITAPVYLDGALVAPTAGGTVSVYDDTGEAIVDAETVTITGSIAEFTVDGSLTSDRSPSPGWRVVWALVVSGVPFAPRSTAYVVRNRLYPTIADGDIAQRVPVLSVSFAGRPTVATTYQGLINEADTAVQRRLINAGRRPWQVVDAWALREVWLTKTIALIYHNLVGVAGDGDPYTERAAHWDALYEAAWTEATLQLDWDEDGDVDEPDERESARPSGVWLC